MVTSLFELLLDRYCYLPINFPKKKIIKDDISLDLEFFRVDVLAQIQNLSFESDTMDTSHSRTFRA